MGISTTGASDVFQLLKCAHVFAKKSTRYFRQFKSQSIKIHQEVGQIYMVFKFSFLLITHQTNGKKASNMCLFACVCTVFGGLDKSYFHPFLKYLSFFLQLSTTRSLYLCTTLLLFCLRTIHK